MYGIFVENKDTGAGMWLTDMKNGTITVRDSKAYALKFSLQSSAKEAADSLAKRYPHYFFEVIVLTSE